MFISDIDNVQTALSTGIGFIETRHKELGYQNVTIDETYI
jgi:hypothetical protein